MTLFVVCFASASFAAKENPSGLYLLISGKDSFGQLRDHPAISLSYVDGFRFRQTWGAIETTVVKRTLDHLTKLLENCPGGLSDNSEYLIDLTKGTFQRL